MADAVFVADGYRRLAYINRAARELSGWSGGEALGRPISQFVVGDHSPDRPGCRPCQIVTRSGEERPVEASIARLADGRGDGLIIVCRDIGPTVALSAQLTYRAEHDALTGLPNRNQLLTRLGAAVIDASGARHPVAVGFLDIDGMKRVNDTLGHAVGDELLVAVARRLASSVRAGDTVARLGGDEFVVVLGRIDGPARAEAVMRALMQTLSAPYQVASQQVTVGVSAGLAFCPDHGVTRRNCWRARIGRYDAKQTGAGGPWRHAEARDGGCRSRPPRSQAASERAMTREAGARGRDVAALASRRQQFRHAAVVRKVENHGRRT
jgi:diguanylate cyclase (GGDEF)-like protein/PAS domain S-box-containing protein